MSHLRRARRGFTLIQLLLILALLLILLALLLPALVKVRMAALRAQESNNLKQLLLATHNIHDTYSKLPPTFGPFPIDGPRSGEGTVHFWLLPYVEQNNIYVQSMDGGQIPRVSHGATATAVVKVFLAPDNDPSAPPDHLYDGWLALCNYPVNYLVFQKGGVRMASITDGLSNTIFFAQRYQMCNGHPHAWGYDGWYYWAPMFAYYSTDLFQVLPALKDCDPERAQTLSPDGLQAGMGDGSVHFVSPKVSAQTWLFACQPNDGNVLGADW